MTEPTKYALVTGGSRGIGREICLKLARSGYYVLINYRSNADEAQRTLEGVRAAGGDGETLRFDVAAGEETKALAQEVAKKGVTVNAIAPGFVRTDMTADLDEAELKKQIPAGRFCEAAEVADLAMFLISDKASYITGEVISINGGLYT